MTYLLARIADLAAWLAASGLAELELLGPDGGIRLLRGQGGAAAAVAPTPSRDQEPEFGPGPRPGPGPVIVRSPGVGHVLAAHPLRAEPLAAPGERIAAGQPVALMRVGALLRTVTAPQAGIVIRVVAPEGALVGYGDPLVEIRPEG